MLRLLLCLALALCACRSSPEATASGPTPPATAAQPAVPEPHVEPEPPQPANVALKYGEETEVMPGFVATWSGRNHKHGKGFTTAIYQLTLSDGTTTEDLEFRTNDDTLWAEGNSFGQVWSLSGGYESMRIIVGPPEKPPLTEDDARERLRERLESSGIVCTSSASSVSNGVLDMSCRDGETVTGEARIGLFTHAIDAPPVKDETPPVVDKVTF